MNIYRQLSALLSLLDPSQRPSRLLLGKLGISGIYPPTLLFGYGIILPFTNNITYFLIGPFCKIHNFGSGEGEETHKDFPPFLVSWDTFQSCSWRVEGRKYLHPSFKNHSSCLDCTTGQGGKEVGKD